MRRSTDCAVIEASGNFLGFSLGQTTYRSSQLRLDGLAERFGLMLSDPSPVRRRTPKLRCVPELYECKVERKTAKGKIIENRLVMISDDQARCATLDALDTRLYDIGLSLQCQIAASWSAQGFAIVTGPPYTADLRELYENFKNDRVFIDCRYHSRFERERLCLYLDCEYLPALITKRWEEADRLGAEMLREAA